MVLRLIQYGQRGKYGLAQKVIIASVIALDKCQ